MFQKSNKSFELIVALLLLRSMHYIWIRGGYSGKDWKEPLLLNKNDIMCWPWFMAKIQTFTTAFQTSNAPNSDSQNEKGRRKKVSMLAGIQNEIQSDVQKLWKECSFLSFDIRNKQHDRSPWGDTALLRTLCILMHQVLCSFIWIFSLALEKKSEMKTGF